MYNNYYAEEYLIHFGTKGMKWGVRRYQNKDGSLTDAGKKRLSNELVKEYKREYSSAQPGRVGDIYKNKLKDEVKKVITDDDKTRIADAKKKFLSAMDEVDKAEAELDKIATKYGKEYYDAEMKRNPDYYTTERSQDKLFEYAVYDYGFDKARKSRPDLAEAERAGDKYWDEYRNECKKVSDKILGSYGDTKLHESKYYSLTIKDTVGDIVSSMDRNNWE